MTVFPNQARVHAWALLVSLVLVAGCGSSGPARFHVSGSVSYKGKPLPAGVILFDPDPTRGGDGPQGFAHVKEGKFDTRDAGATVVAGPTLVVIQGFDGKPGNELPLGKLLFGEYTIPTELKPNETSLQFDVPK